MTKTQKIASALIVALLVTMLVWQRQQPQQQLPQDPNAERCNDMMDNDHDGVVDEGCHTAY